MSIHFAAARRVTWSPVARALARRARGRAANDNSNAPTIDSDALLRSTLEHLGAHGLGAARHAFAKAEVALKTDDKDAYAKWHAICRSLDRRMAEKLEAHEKHLNACA